MSLAGYIPTTAGKDYKMKNVDIEHIRTHLESEFFEYYRLQTEFLNEISLELILSRINPYLLCEMSSADPRNLMTGGGIVRYSLDNAISPLKRRLFDDLIRKTAVFVCHQAYGGSESALKGIDLEFDRDGVRYIVTISPSPTQRSNEIRRMRAGFAEAKRSLGDATSKRPAVAVCGCCYGRTSNPDKGWYLEYCGQHFWEFISGRSDLYVEVIGPLWFEAQRNNATFLEAYSPVLNCLTTEFIQRYCRNGQIDWKLLVESISSKLPA